MTSVLSLLLSLVLSDSPNTSPRRRPRREARRRFARSRPRLEVLEDRALPSAYVVTTTANDGQGSLHDAINQVNAGHYNEIDFSLPWNDPGHVYYQGSVGNVQPVPAASMSDADLTDAAPQWTHSWWSIQPTGGLPAITNAVLIDGTSQAGYSASPLIELQGSNAGTAVNGLTVAIGGAGSVIKGLVIDGFGGNGIELDASNCTVASNYIGTNPAGNAASANGASVNPYSSGNGVFVFEADNEIVGGTAAAARNVISGNLNNGISLFFTNGDVIQNNYVGTDASGNAAVGNAEYGILAYDASNVSLGGIGAGNVVSGNRAGVISHGDGWLIQGNLIGTNAAGTAALGNQAFDGGLRFTAGVNNTVGGTAAGAGNVIAGNDNSGVVLTDGSRNNVVEGNYIGTNSAGANLGNGRFGVVVYAFAYNNLIGGTGSGAGNVIAYNAWAGVSVGVTYDTNVGVVGNAILGNSIHDNGGPGIVLSTSAANNNQAAPALTSTVSGLGLTVVTGTVASVPSVTVRVEFFANPPGDPEGRTLLGSCSVPTDAAGNGSFTAALAVALPAGQGLVTATVTDPSGNTSQFSSGITATHLTPSSLSGVVWEDFNNDGQVDFGESGIDGVTITLAGTDFLGRAVNVPAQQTSGGGAYSFLNLLPANYTITETQPAGYGQGINPVGTAGGSVTADQFTVALGLGADGLNYNYGEQPPAGSGVKHGQTAGIGFWNNKNGQALLKALNGGGADGHGAHQLGDWLAATLPNTFGVHAGGDDLAGKDNAYVAALFQQDFVTKGVKLDAQLLATALSVYATNATLDPTQVAASYGFTVTGDGAGTATFNVGSNGDAFGVSSNSTLTLMDLLLAADAQAVNGVLYNGNTTKRNQANNVFSAVNQAGGL
jgi:hypothetical protein